MPRLAPRVIPPPPAGEGRGEGPRRKQPDRIILDMDSTVSETYGQQEGSAYNGYFACECYHPLFCFNQFGDVERALLRNGNGLLASGRRAAFPANIGGFRGSRYAEFLILPRQWGGKGLAGPPTEAIITR